MKLRELDARFIKIAQTDPEKIWAHVESINDAQGVIFLCPACYKKHGGPEGTHSILCWSRSRGVPDDFSPKPGRWTLHGAGIDDLTLLGDPVGSAASVDAGCWHGFVKNGEIT